MAMVDLPSVIRVGYRDLAVTEKTLQSASADQHTGSFDKDSGTITVCLAFGPQVAAEILLHEVLHAAYQFGCLGPDANEEKTISILANQMTQVWRDNPAFVAFMSGAFA